MPKLGFEFKRLRWHNNQRMISFKNVSKIYNENIVALRDVTFNIDDGEFMFLVGHSGAGKSTLIRLLIRQEIPTEGDILFGDIDVKKITRKMLPVYRQNIGVVFQDYKLIESKTIEENIEFALEITGKNDGEIKETTNSLLDIVRLEERADLFPAQLSGGEKQRAGIARALANDPKLLIADEPTGNLDPKTSKEIMEILEKINSWGTTIMIATHDKETVNRLKKRVVRLEKGTVASDIQNSNYHGMQVEAEADAEVGADAESEVSADAGAETKTKNEAKSESESKSKTKPKSTDDKKNEQLKNDDTRTENTEPKNEDKNHEHLGAVEELSIGKLSLPSGIQKILEKNDLDTLGKLLDLSEADLDNIKGIGKKKRKLIIQEIERFITREKE
jgi:cell division transport system ATP-binding protein